MSLEQVQQQAVATYNSNIAYFKEHHPDLYNNLVVFETALNGNHIKAQYDLQYKENYFEIIGLEQNIPFYGQNSVALSQAMVDKNLTMDATINSFKAYYEHKYNDEVAQIALQSDMLVKYTISIAPLVHYVNKNLPHPQIIKDVHKYIIFGVGLGLHIPYIHQKIHAKMYLIVESNLEIFRLSLFVTNYAQLAQEAKLLFAVAQNEVPFRETFNKLYAEAFVLNHYFKFFQFSGNNDLYFKTIQNFLVSQPHYLYSYDRTFLSLLRTHSYISQGYKTLNIKEINQLKLFEKPVLYLAAGPSLQRNIEFVKQNQDKFIVVAIYATLPLLEQHGIKPNIVTQYDEQDIQVLNTLDRINDINYFNETIFIFSSHVNAKLMTSFPKENIFIFQAMFELKKEFGMLTSPSIGELTYGLLLKLGAKNIYILGLDLAMDVETNQTHIDGHSGSNIFKELKELEDSSDTEYSYRKNTILIKGNFIDEVKSIPVFKTNIDSFGVLTKQFKSNDCKVYNLSNGAYLEGADPKRIEDIAIDAFEDFIYTHLQQELDIALKSISEENYNTNDIENINLKISGAKKIKKILDLFFKVKNYKDIDEYKNKLILMLSDILFAKYNCEDLQQILINYTSHVSHHIFHLFSLESINDYKKHIYEVNKALSIQLHKIVNTYVISITYSKDENSITKKLNKYIKEYSIKSTSYSEPQFKELVETSLKGEQIESGKNSIGFFAIEENLNNKDFIEYIENIIKRFPDIKLKLFYFYDYQKVLAQHTLKKHLKNIELIIPHNIQEIAKEVEIWIESSEKTFSLKKCNDILLNNYTNIHSFYFTKEEYNKQKELKFLDTNSLNKKETLKDTIEENYFIPTTSYYSFANSLKDEIDYEKLNSLYQKEHIGFFAFEENLTKEFVQKIIVIFNKFPQLKFVAFYFDEKQKQKFELQFKNLLSRFIFISPRNIYDIAENIEIWVQAKIKNRSFLHVKIIDTFIFHKKTYISIPDINVNINLNNISDSCYLKNIIENYTFIKNFKDFYHLTNIQIADYTKKFKRIIVSEIGFMGIKENLEDYHFLKYLEKLLYTYPHIKVKCCIFDKKLNYPELSSLKKIENFEILEWTDIEAFLSQIDFYYIGENINSNVDTIWDYILNTENDIFLGQHSTKLKNNQPTPLPEIIKKNIDLFSYNNAQSSLEELAFKSAIIDLGYPQDFKILENMYNFFYFTQLEYLNKYPNLSSRIMHYRKLIFKTLYNK